MLKSWHLRNFKAIREAVDLQLAGVTVLSGLNSSGKTSVLQSVRLISQTLSSPVVNSALILNGYSIQLGTFDIIHNDRTEDQHFEIGFSLQLSSRQRFNLPMPPVSRNRPTSSSNRDLSTSVNASFGRIHSKGHAQLEPASVQLVSTELAVRSEGILQGGPATRPTSRRAESSAAIEVQARISPMTPKEQENFAQSIAPEHERLLPLKEIQWFKIDGPIGDKSSADDECHLVRLLHFLPGPVIKRFSIGQRKREELDRYMRFVFGSSIDSFDNEYLHRRLLGRSESLMELLAQPPPARAVATVHEVIRKVGQRRKFHGETLGDFLAWAAEAASDAERRGKSSTLGSELNVMLSDLIEQSSDSGTNRREPYGLEFARGDVFVDLLDDAASAITNFFVRGVRYLGPLRAEPSRAQGFSPTSEPDDVGPRGEYAAAVYEANKRRVVSWWNPETQEEAHGPLANAMDFWISHLGVARQVSTRDTGETGVVWEVRPREGSDPRPLTSVGVGVSQILPILVAGLLIPGEGVLLIEQPELHLHPKAQARLADFFFSLAFDDKQCIIETHSDALVNQFRYQIVSLGQSARERIAIYFVNQDSDGSSHFNQIEISKHGNITNWPNDFFDETLLLEDRIAKASLAQRANSLSND